MELKGKRILVIGLGETGLAMARWLLREGAIVRVADSRTQPPNIDTLCAIAPQTEVLAGPFTDETFTGIDLIAISPGVPLQTPLVQSAAARGIPVISEIELFAWGIRKITPMAKLIAITGSNGKTTTTALTAYLLNAAGVPAIACGNISPSALDALMNVVDGQEPCAPPSYPMVWVLELSSFQLETTHSLNAHAATVLNISEDHLDRYPGMAEYMAAKKRVFQGCGVMVINRDEEHHAAGEQGGHKIVSFGLDAAPRSIDYGLLGKDLMRGNEKLIALDSLRLIGKHNAANALAALALCEAIGVAPWTLLPALVKFTGLAHRVEFIAKIDGVSYYDDSKGTNVGATLAAVQGLGCKVAIILGGEGKEQDFSPLAPALARHARAVALIGRDAKLIATDIKSSGIPTQHCGSLEEAVRWCATQTAPGDAVLLSPACASFDMFRNYGHRAEVFVSTVLELKKESA